MVSVRNGASELRIRKQSKNSAYSQQSGPISHIVWTVSILIFIRVTVKLHSSQKRLETEQNTLNLVITCIVNVHRKTFFEIKNIFPNI